MDALKNNTLILKTCDWLSKKPAMKKGICLIKAWLIQGGPLPVTSRVITPLITPGTHLLGHLWGL